jgi:hypothetical protein
MHFRVRENAGRYDNLDYDNDNDNEAFTEIRQLPTPRRQARQEIQQGRSKIRITRRVNRPTPIRH